MSTINAQYKKLKRDALKSVKQHFKKMNLEWYSCNMVDAKHPTGWLQIAALKPPFTFFAPGFHEADSKGMVEVTHVQKDGLQFGLLTMLWKGMDLDFLARLDEALTKYNKRHGNV